MRTEVNQENLPLLIPGKITGMTKILCNKLHLNAIDCLKIIYKSKTYHQLEQEDSKFWHYGPVALCEILKEEIQLKLSEDK